MSMHEAIIIILWRLFDCCLGTVAHSRSLHSRVCRSDGPTSRIRIWRTCSRRHWQAQYPLTSDMLCSSAHLSNGNVRSVPERVNGPFQWKTNRPDTSLTTQERSCSCVADQGFKI